jgi:hypothetical protein
VCRLVSTEGALPAAPPAGLGDGWRQLVAGVSRELLRLDPPARAVPVLDAHGVLELVLYDPRRRARARELCEKAERLARTRCELCAAPGAPRAGPVTIVLCDRCAAG